MIALLYELPSLNETVPFVYSLDHTSNSQSKKMFNQDEGEIECADRMCLAEQESRYCFDFISDVRICGISLSQALGTAKFKQLD